MAARRRGHDDPRLSPAQAGHARLHERHEAVLEALSKDLSEPEPEPESESESDPARISGRASPALARALRDHGEALNAHLDLEEALVIPRLLDLSRAEFHAYSHGSIDALLAQSPAAPASPDSPAQS